MSSDPIEVLRTLRDRYSHNRHAVLALDAAIASLSASKPESAEAVGEVLRSGNGVARVAMFNDSLRPGTKVYTTPPRAEASKWKRIIGNWQERVAAAGFNGVEEAIEAIEASIAPQQASGLSRSLKLAAAEEQAEAWQAVCALLSELRPDWAVGTGTGQELALAAIRHVLSPAPQQASASDTSVAGVEGLVERMRHAPSRLWMADLVGQQISVERMREILTTAFAGQSLKNESDQEQQGGPQE